jgi:PPM family protein phosphatase
VPWLFGEAMDIGGRSEQQDRARVFSGADDTHLAVVADGMGGHASGAAAAQAVIDAAERHFLSTDTTDPRTFLENVCLEAHRAINAIGRDDELSPGSTCVILYVRGPEAYWVHIGDGRLYHFRDGELLSRTQDHSVVQLMLEQGRIGEGEASGHALRNQIYMRLGGAKPPEPEFGCLAVEPNDAFLLCSDGLWEHANGPAIQSIPSDGSVEDISTGLVRLARERAGSDGDNVSVVFARWLFDGSANEADANRARWHTRILQLGRKMLSR